MKAGETIVEKAVDMALILIYFNLEVPFLLGHKRHLIEDKVSEDLENFDYQKLKRALCYLKEKGLVNVIKEAEKLPKITQSGEEKIKSILPFYDEKRIWDGKIYLVTYDIPETKKRIRDILRTFLKKIGCGMLQQSIWITPYNPMGHIKKFIKDKDLDEGLILVSSVGKNGTVGQLSLSDLIEKVYKLSVLNQKYSEFIQVSMSEKVTRSQLIFFFLSILKDDPQIPFSLLPKNWEGDKAYKIYKSLQNHQAAA